MAARSRMSQSQVDELLKSMLVFSRTVQHVLEARAVEVANEPLSPSKVQILRLLGSRGSQKPTQIAQFLGVSKPAVTQLMASMEDARLIRRVQDRKDRRVQSINLSRRGRNILEKIHTEQRHLVRNAFLRSTGTRTDAWIETLSDVSASLARSESAFEQFCYQCGAHADGSCVLVGGEAHCLFLESQKGKKG